MDFNRLTSSAVPSVSGLARGRSRLVVAVVAHGAARGARASGWVCLLFFSVIGLGCAEEPAGTSNRAARGGGAGGPAAIQGANGDNVLLPSASTIQPGASTGGGCVPGHYVGSFDGTYNSAAWGNGSVPLSIRAVDSMGRPGLEFWLEQTSAECAVGAEFCADFTVKGGKIRGFANPFSDPNSSSDDSDGFVVAVRFEIDFGGELDCSSGQFRGLLQNGCYDVATILFRFEGTAPATYDHASSSFTDGQWSVKELAMPDSLLPPDPSIGGMGSWNAALAQDDAMPEDVSAGLCHM